jgi:hypothetical protein
MRVNLDITEHHQDGRKTGRWDAGDCYGYLSLEPGESYAECDDCSVSTHFGSLKEAALWISGHVGAETLEVRAYDEVRDRQIKQLGRKI